jgi:hypothetical protein
MAYVNTLALTVVVTCVVAVVTGEAFVCGTTWIYAAGCNNTNTSQLIQEAYPIGRCTVTRSKENLMIYDDGPTLTPYRCSSAQTCAECQAVRALCLNYCDDRPSAVQGFGFGAVPALPNVCYEYNVTQLFLMVQWPIVGSNWGAYYMCTTIPYVASATARLASAWPSLMLYSTMMIGLSAV